jgi:hypothetical protein
MRYTLITEGGQCTVDYLSSLGYIPDTVIFDIDIAISECTMLNKDDSVLLLVHGLTDFNVMSLYKLMQTITTSWKTCTENGTQLENAFEIIVLSDCNLSYKNLPCEIEYYGKNPFVFRTSKRKTKEIGTSLNKIVEQMKTKSVNADQDQNNIKQPFIIGDEYKPITQFNSQRQKSDLIILQSIPHITPNIFVDEETTKNTSETNVESSDNA